MFDQGRFGQQIYDGQNYEGRGLSFWRALAAPHDATIAPDDPLLQAWVERLAYLLSLPLADAILKPAQLSWDRHFFDSDRLNQALLLHRYTRAAQEQCLQVIAEAGVESVVIKGLALALRYYDEPDCRVPPVGDLDVLVRQADLEPLVRHLKGMGYRFSGHAEAPWGFISTASFLPFMSPDDRVNLDLHVRPDSFPLYLALDSDAVFARALWVERSWGGFRCPSDEHALLILVSNAAKDKFGPFALKKLIDATVLLSNNHDLDWRFIETTARNAGLGRPLRAFFALMAALGFDCPAVPQALKTPPGSLATGEFQRVLDQWSALFPSELAGFDALRRELLLSSELRTGLFNNWLRLKGLVRPASGLPDINPDISAKRLST